MTQKPKSGKSRRSRARQARRDGGVERHYGLHSVRAVLENEARTITGVWVTERAGRKLDTALANADARGIKIVHADPAEVAALCEPGAVHQGCVVEAHPLNQPSLEQLAAANGLVIVLDQITDPHNVGAIARTAAAFGAAGLVTTRRSVPQITPSLAKSASGALEVLPLIRVSNLARSLDQLADRGYRLVGLDSAGARPLEESDLTRPLALVLGAEGSGLRRLTAERCDVMARLDMPGPIKSLNVSNAAAVALTLASRRRN